MNADQQNLSQETMSRIVALERFTRRIPSRFTSPAAPLANLWLVVGGNVLTYLSAPGIIRRLDTIASSELPNGGAGTGIIIVPPNSAMAGLPNGIGVAQRYDGTDLTWVILDAGTSAVVPDLIGNNDVIKTSTTYVFDKVSGPTTWRYNCIRPVAGWW